MNLHVRLATDDDFETILSIWLEGIENSFEINEQELNSVKEKFHLNFKNRSGIFNFWVAIDEQQNVLGWQSLIKGSNNPFRENVVAESSTYISKSNKHKGLGKLLLDFVLAEAEKSKLEYVFGFVATENVPAIKLTKETGWIKVGDMPNSLLGENKIKKTFFVRPV